MDEIREEIITRLIETKLFSCIEKSLFEKLFKDSYYTFEKLSPEKELTVKNSLALIVSGELEAYKNEGGKRIYLKRISEGEITGIATLFDKNGQYISTLVAKKTSEAVLLSEDFILSLLRTSPDFSERFSRIICDKLRYLNSRIDTYTQPSVEDKLLEYIKASAKASTPHPFIEMSMLSLSSALGVGRASLYRALTSLEEANTIKKEGKKIYLLK